MAFRPFEGVQLALPIEAAPVERRPEALAATRRRPRRRTIQAEQLRLPDTSTPENTETMETHQ